VTAPTPPADLAARSPRLLRLAAGAPLHRFYTAAFEPAYFDRTLAGRLNAPDATYGVLYAAEEISGAFAETFLRQPGLRQLDPGLLARKAYVRFETTRALTLIELAGPGLAIVGATAEVVHGGLPYDVPQQWSHALHSHSLVADGIAYHARHDDRALCYALFNRASSHITEVERRVDLDADWFWQLADIYQMGFPPP